MQPHVSTSMCTLKIPTRAGIPLFGHTKILHTLIGMGSTALAAAVSHQGKATRIFRKGPGSIKKKKKKKKQKHTKQATTPPKKEEKNKNKKEEAAVMVHV